jgi:hypothetical protein
VTAQIRQNRKTLAGSSAALPFMVVYGPTQDIDDGQSLTVHWDTVDAASDTSVFSFNEPGVPDTITLNEDGIYLLSATASYSPSGALSGSERLALWHAVNSSVIGGAETDLAGLWTALLSPCAVTWPASAGDTCEVDMAYNSGGADTITVVLAQWSIVQLVKL